MWRLIGPLRRSERVTREPGVEGLGGVRFLEVVVGMVFVAVHWSGRLASMDTEGLLHAILCMHECIRCK